MDIRRIAVIGAGVMGTVIAQDAAAHGMEVVLIDRQGEALARALKHIEDNLDAELKRWGITNAEKKLILSRIRKADDIQEARQTDIVLEAIPDDLAMKRDLFARLEEGFAPGRRNVTFISTTAVLPIGEIARDMKDKTCLIGAQLLISASSSGVLEVARSEFSSQATVDSVRELAQRMGKTTVDVQDQPGHLSARLVVPVINEAAALYQKKTATKEDIDTAVCLGTGCSRGPLALADAIGLDTVLAWSEYLFRVSGEAQFRPQPILQDMVRQHRLGVKNGEGFYTYASTSEKPEEKL